MRNRFVPLLLLALSLFGCVRLPAPVTKPGDALGRVSPWRLPVISDDLEFKGIAGAVRQSLEYYKKLPPDAPLSFGPENITALDMITTLQNFLLIVENESLSPERKIALIRNDFLLYRSVGSDRRGTVLFTGYYEPVLSCRTAPDDIFRFPLYGRPDDLLEIDLRLFGEGFPRNTLFGRLEGKKIIPYFSREEIDLHEALAGRGLEALWCSDVVDIYVLQIQGSGKADLGDGNILSVLYDGQNGWPYNSIGKYLIEAGAIARKNMSLQAIRDYLSSHPDRLRDVLNRNPSYVFFRLDMGPAIGSVGVPLTPGRSIATDNRLFPKGALGLITTQKPEIENDAVKRWAPFTRFVLNQDTGGAIKGAGRVDLFFGPGREAELSAGAMRQEGELYFLLRKK